MVGRHVNNELRFQQSTNHSYGLCMDEVKQGGVDGDECQLRVVTEEKLQSWKFRVMRQ